MSLSDDETPEDDATNQGTNAEGGVESFGSSLSVHSDLSDISSPPSSLSSKATTPAEADVAGDDSGGQSTPTTPQKRSYRHDIDRLAFNIRPKSSIPTNMSPTDYATECAWAAETCRLNPHALDPEEYHLFRHHISHVQVTTYLNIRNSILRLWVQQPWVGVERQAAIGCANARWFDAASVCFDWLVRKGYINHGCLNISGPRMKSNTEDPPLKKRKTIAVIGAGMSGLSCARQLEGLFKQYADRFRERGEEAPKVVILEGRNRVGGRVYSREFKTKPAQVEPGFQGKRHTAEMGGMIITGFEKGNPINILVRAQLGMAYHTLLSDTTLYDSSGKEVDLTKDQLVEKLYQDCQERVSVFLHKTQPSKLIEGNRELIEEGRDSLGDGSKTIMQAELATAALPDSLSVAQQSVPEKVSMVPVSSDKVTGRVHTQPGIATTAKASEKAKEMGWKLKASAMDHDSFDLHTAANAEGATLGSVLDSAVTQYKQLVDLNPLEHRLFNWHVANLEYSNATSVHNLSVQLWDLDAGMEWEGRHAMVIGGYQSVARGLLQYPTPMDIKKQFPVKAIRYNSVDAEGSAEIECEDGTLIEADNVVCTIPLGVLKQNTLGFDPPLPSWKSGAIDRIGFGVLNKICLIYDKAFWDSGRDIFGVLKDAPNRHSIHQRDYSANRGRFFQWFNVSPATGLPCLVALMAGEAGFDTEASSNDMLVAEATGVLRSIFGKDVPQPTEAIVTRWASDRFARGSYSSAAPGMLPDDYDQLARPIGNLFFAGEHTIGHYPATVHGAYMSGLRAASEVLESLLGPIEVPTPLVLPKDSLLLHKRKQSALDPRQARLEAYELEIWEHIHSKLGERPARPEKASTNAYIIYSKVKFDEAKKRCEESRKSGGRNKHIPNEVRMMTSRMWKEASPEERKPFEDEAAENKAAHADAMQKYTEGCEKWDEEASVLRTQYEKEHPSVPGPDEDTGTPNKYRRAKPMSYAE